MTIGRVLVDGLIVCIPFTVVVWASFLSMPRVWLHSLPPDIQAMAPPKTPAERKRTALLAPVMLGTLFGLPALLTWRLHLQTPGGLSFSEALTHLYGVFMVVNLWDLVLIDWPYAYFMDPSRPPIPGTEGAAGYKDYGFHARKFVKGSILSLAFIVPVALVISSLPVN